MVHGLDEVGRIVSVHSGCNGSNAAVTAGGEAYAWGYAQEGNLGRGDDCDDAHVPERLKPTRAMAGKKVVAVSFGVSTRRRCASGGRAGTARPGASARGRES